MIDGQQHIRRPPQARCGRGTFQQTGLALLWRRAARKRKSTWQRRHVSIHLIFHRHRDNMQAIALVVLAAAALVAVRASDDKGDVGTVIGIDLGTTYSWFVSSCLDGASL
jgi:hypothetical protein